jgi:hypothetical protein
MSSSEMIRLRRQMHRRIQAVVAERRMARQDDLIKGEIADQGPVAADPPAEGS